MRPARAIACLFVSIAMAAPAPSTAADRRTDQAALKTYGSLVGRWKGVGQPQRGSTRGSWTEAGDWSWKLSNDSASMELVLKGGKYLKGAELRPGAEDGTFVLNATLTDGATREFAGKPGDKGKLPLTANEGEGLSRITLTPLHETRFLLLLEERDASGNFSRLGEVGFTRQGVAFALGESGPTCIVTEGRGTIPVKYQGQTYYVCCSGCKELFDENPEAALAEAKARDDAKAKTK